MYTTGVSNLRYTTRIRASAHDLRVETGRYEKKGKQTTPLDKACRFCCAHNIRAQDSKASPTAHTSVTSRDTVKLVVEDEVHVLVVCPAYHHLRIQLSEELKCHLLLHQFSFIMYHPPLLKELSKYLDQCHKLRNPDRDTTAKIGKRR